MHNVLAWARRHQWLAAGAMVVLMGLLAARPLGWSGKVSELAAPPAQAAAVDYFLQLDGIDGESTDEQHPNTLNIESWSWGDGEPGLVQARTGAAGGGGGAGKVTVHDIHFTANVSKASPKLMQATATGKHLKTATLFVRKAGGSQDYFVIKLTDVLVSSYSVGSSDTSSPTDQFSLNFARVAETYQPQRTDGSLDDMVQAAFDVQANRAD